MTERFTVDADIETGAERKETPTLDDSVLCFQGSDCTPLDAHHKAIGDYDASSTADALIMRQCKKLARCFLITEEGVENA